MDNNFGTVIGSSTQFKGTVNLDQNLLISGSFEGDIISTADIVIKGYCKGTVKCSNLSVYGKAEGEVYCENTFAVIPGGEFTGKITAKNLEMNEGSVFNGDIHMLHL